MSTAAFVPDVVPRAVIVEKVQSIGPRQATWSAEPGVGDTLSPGFATPAHLASSPDLAAEYLDTGKSTPTSTSLAGRAFFDQSTTLVVFSNGMPSSVTSRGATPAMLSAFFAGHSAPETTGYPGFPHGGVSMNPAPLHGALDGAAEDRYEFLHGMVDYERDVSQPVGPSPAALGEAAGVTAVAAVEAHEPSGVTVVNGGNGGIALPARVASGGNESTPSFEFGRFDERPIPPVTAPSIVSVESLSGIAVRAAAAAVAAAGSVIAGHADSEAAGGPAALAPPNATPVEAGIPEPHGVGLIAELLPFDGDTVAAAIDRFFDRFEGPGAEAVDDREPAAVSPPPSAVLIAVAAVEAARRYYQRRKAATTGRWSRRRNAAGVHGEESFGSSGPWSSRLS